MTRNIPPKTPAPDTSKSRRWFLGLGAAAAATTFIGVGSKYFRNAPKGDELVPIVSGVIEITPAPTPDQATEELLNLLNRYLKYMPEAELPDDREIHALVHNMRKAHANVNAVDEGNELSNTVEDQMKRIEKPSLLISAIYEHSMQLSPKRKAAIGSYIHAILEAGADINAKTASGKSTPLHVAVTQDNPNIVMLLLQSKKIVLNAKDINGYTAADYAQSDPMKMMLRNGNVPNSEKFFTNPPTITPVNASQSAAGGRAL